MNAGVTSPVLLITIFSWYFRVCTAQRDPCSPTDGQTEVVRAVSESAALGDEVYTVKIFGNSSTVSLAADKNKFFTFDPTTWKITVSGVLDAETNRQPQSLTINCRELASQRMLSIYVNIIIADANDHSPVFASNVYNLTIGEMTEVNSTIQTGVTATDGDATPDYNIIYYSIVNGPYKDYFTIVNPLKVDLTLLKQLDYENLSSFSITIMAMDQPKSGSVQFNTTCILSIIVEDQDDQYPVFNSSLYRGLISNTTSIGSVVPISPPIFAFDPDLSFRARVIYTFHGPEFHNTPGQTILSQTDSAGQNDPIFGIDPNTAEVKLVSRPTSEEIYLLVQATQEDNPSRYGVALLTIHIQGSNVNAPVFTRSSYQMVIPEVFPVGEVIIAVFAIDSDLDSTVKYSLDDPSKTFDIFSDTGDIVLIKELSFVLSDQYIMTATASDGILKSNVTVTIKVRPVYSSPPRILNSALNVTAQRKRGDVIIDIDAKDSDEGTTLVYSLLSYNELFSISTEGIITIIADPVDLDLNVYPVTVMVSDGGQPSYEKAAVVLVSFPDIPAIASAQVVDENNIATIVLAVVAGFLLIIIIILIVYICRRRLRDKEHFDRVKKQYPSQIPKALTFKQNKGTLGHQTMVDVDGREDFFDGDTNVQENPLNSDTKGGYYNFGIISNSDTETEIDVQEMQVNSQFEMHQGDSNNNEHIYNTSQCSVDSEGYSTTGKSALTPFYRNGSVSTYRDSSESDASFSFSPSANSSSKVPIAGPLTRTHEENGGFWNKKDNSLPSSAMPSLDPHGSVAPTSQKQELTVYF